MSTLSLLVAALAFVAASLFAATPAMATPPVEPPLDEIVMPQDTERGDVAFGAADIVAVAVKSEGRGLRLNLAFAHPLTAKSKTTVCWQIGSTRACLNHDRTKLVVGKKTVDVYTRLRQGRFLSTWVRAAHLGIKPGQSLSYKATADSKGCVAETGLDGMGLLPCVDTTAPVRAVYKELTSCVNKPRGGLYLNGPRTQKVVALTYDDGPHAATKGLLDTLKAEKVPATFFMNGVHIRSHLSSVKRMKAEGHELANHSWGHELLPSSSSIARTQALLRQTVKYTPCSFRPPYGANNAALLSRLASQNLAAVNWDVDTRDWESHSTSSIIRIGSSGKNSSIILMHDGGGGNYATARATGPIIRNYRARGYRFVTVDELLGWTNGPIR